MGTALVAALGWAGWHLAVWAVWAAHAGLLLLTSVECPLFGLCFTAC